MTMSSSNDGGGFTPQQTRTPSTFSYPPLPLTPLPTTSSGGQSESPHVRHHRESEIHSNYVLPSQPFLTGPNEHAHHHGHSGSGGVHFHPPRGPLFVAAGAPPTVHSVTHHGPVPIPPAFTQTTSHSQPNGDFNDSSATRTAPAFESPATVAQDPPLTPLPIRGNAGSQRVTPQAGPGPSVASSFVDEIANRFRFVDTDNHFRQTMHTVLKMGNGLSQPDLATRLFLLAVLFCILREVQKLFSISHDTQTFIGDLRQQFDTNFTCNTEQRAIIRIRAADLMFDPRRIAFMELHNDVMDDLRSNIDNYGFTNIFLNPHREKIVRDVTKSICSGVRNGYREVIRDSVFGQTATPLQDMVVHLTARFKQGGIIQTADHELVLARCAILRRFALEHPSLLNRDEESDVEGDSVEDQSAGGENRGPEEGSTRSSSTPATGGSGKPQSKKRKRTVTPLIKKNPLSGQDFWSQVELWFKAHHLSWTRKWSSAGWQAYIAETLKLDNERFKPEPVGNPYMDEPTITTNTPITTAATSEVENQVFASMDGILAVMGNSGNGVAVDANYNWV
ncbi:hypothetical protein BXZ70DRAFT_669876 [Cristinia sonorae]|uniref:Uncharacterized protein n=1 Tax=Cristinia sonorae TaxID=1940300 RepID=A0A8K0UTA2_9AGAR|nr:hypothetical protein BXZ70DRAFT_669876 [Cristinia sonorae]